MSNIDNASKEDNPDCEQKNQQNVLSVPDNMDDAAYLGHPQWW